MKNNRILILAIFSIVGIITSTIFIGVMNYITPSWSYFLTDNAEEQYSTCSMSEDGKFVVVGSGNDYLYLFKYDRPVPLWKYKMSNDIISVDISADGQYIVASDLAANAYLFQRNFPIPKKICTGLPYMITAAKISADGNYIVVREGISLRLYRREGLTLLWTTDIGGGSFPLIDVSDNGNEIVIVLDGILYFFEKYNSFPLWTYNSRESVITSLAISPKGDIIILGGQNYRIDILSRTGPVPFRSYNTNNSVRSLSLSKDGASIAAGCADGCYLYNTPKQTYVWNYPLISDSSPVAISLDGEFIVGGNLKYDDENCFLYCLNKAENVPLWSIRMNGIVNQVSISKEGDSIGVATQHYFYYINRLNPLVFEFNQLLFSLTFPVLCISSCLGPMLVLWYMFNIYTEKKINKYYDSGRVNSQNAHL